MMLSNEPRKKFNPRRFGRLRRVEPVLVKERADFRLDPGAGCLGLQSRHGRM